MFNIIHKSLCSWILRALRKCSRLSIYSTIFTHFYKQVIIYTTLCVVSGIYYGATISKNEETVLAHTSDTLYQETQTNGQVATSARFQQPKQTKNIQDLKNTITQRTKELTDHIQDYCKTRDLPNPLGDPNYPTQLRLYFDFAHSFLYCPINKVNPSTLLTIYIYIYIYIY